MTRSLKLYTFPNNARAAKALIAGEYNGLKIEQVHNFDAKSKDFLEKNPLGKIPVLETEKGNVFESNAIARYVARIRQDTELYGANFFESGLIDQWVDFCTNEVELAASAWVYPVLGYMEANPAATAKAQEDIKKAFAILDKHLLTRTYLVGNKITLADICVVCGLFYLMTKVADAGFRKPFTNLVRWYTTCVNQPEFKKVLGDANLCETAATAGGAAATPKAKEEKKKEAAPKAAKPAKKKEEEEEEEESYEDKPSKEDRANHWSNSLPQSAFVMDEWKKTFSNNDKKTVALPWFWEKYDPACMSLWACDYLDAEKYAEDKSYKNSNLVAGMFQRCDKVRKYGFGAHVIVGEEPPKGHFNIFGVWVFRGHVVPPEMTAVDDYENYSWRKLDHTKPEDRKWVETVWLQEGDMRGQRYHCGEVFK